MQVDTSHLSPMAALAVAVATPIIAWISEKLYDGLKTIIPGFDKMSATIHMALAPIFGFVLGWITSHLGLAAIADVHDVTANVISGVLNALLMAGIFRWEKAHAPGDTTVKVEAARAGVS